MHFCFIGPLCVFLISLYCVGFHCEAAPPDTKVIITICIIVVVVVIIIVFRG